MAKSIKLAPHHKKIERLLKDHGIKHDVAPTNGGHIQFKWAIGDRKQSLTVAKTPSDHRAPINNLLQAKRLLKEAGIDVTAAKTKRNGAAHATAHHRHPKSVDDLVQRIESLERDVRMLLDALTEPEHVPAPAKAPAAPAAKKRGWGQRGEGQRGNLSKLWRTLQFDAYLSVGDVAKGIGRTYTATAVLLTALKKKGLVQNKPRVGWRRDIRSETFR